MAGGGPKVVKTTLNAGKGKLPAYEDGTKAFFHYEILRPTDLSQGMPTDRDCYESIDSTRKPWPDGYGEPLELVFGKKFALPVIENALKSMHVGERSQFDIEASELSAYPITSKKLRDIAKNRLPPSAGHSHHHDHGTSHMCAASLTGGTGYPALDALLKSPQPLRMIIDLLDVQEPGAYEAESWQLDPEAKLASIENLRTRGNDMYKDGNVEGAILKYQEALGRLETLILREKPGEPEWIDLDQRNVVLYINLSQCYLRMNRLAEAEETASEALSRDEHNEKALFRRAKARIGSWKLDEAEEDLARLEETSPGMTAMIEAERRELARRRADQEEGQKTTAKNMMRAFGGK